MPSFTKTLTALLSLLTEMIQKNESIDVFCSKVKSIESIHPRFYPLVNECYKLSEKKEYCICGDEDCDCSWDF
jgi:hypothetical protein